MKYFTVVIIAIVCLLYPSDGYGQTFKVSDVKELVGDISARTKPVMTSDGQRCPLLKVQIIASDVKFSGNVVSVVTDKPNEYWVYVHPNTAFLKASIAGKRLTITRPGAVFEKDKTYGVKIEGEQRAEDETEKMLAAEKKLWQAYGLALKLNYSATSESALSLGNHIRKKGELTAADHKFLDEVAKIADMGWVPATELFTAVYRLEEMNPTQRIYYSDLVGEQEEYIRKITWMRFLENSFASVPQSFRYKLSPSAIDKVKPSVDAYNENVKGLKGNTIYFNEANGSISGSFIYSINQPIQLKHFWYASDASAAFVMVELERIWSEIISICRGAGNEKVTESEVTTTEFISTFCQVHNFPMMYWNLNTVKR